jgi:hypothetical protein
MDLLVLRADRVGFLAKFMICSQFDLSDDSSASAGDVIVSTSRTFRAQLLHVSRKHRRTLVLRPCPFSANGRMSQASGYEQWPKA